MRSISFSGDDPLRGIWQSGRSPLTTQEAEAVITGFNARNVFYGQEEAESDLPPAEDKPYIPPVTPPVEDPTKNGDGGKSNTKLMLGLGAAVLGLILATRD